MARALGKAGVKCEQYFRLLKDATELCAHVEEGTLEKRREAVAIFNEVLQKCHEARDELIIHR